MKIVKDKPYKHPWINDHCCELLRLKQAAVGTDSFPAARDACSSGFMAARQKFYSDTRAKLHKSSARDWWHTSKDLLSHTAGKVNIPPLESDNVWAITPDEKAALLASTFAQKSVLPAAEVNDFTPISESRSHLRCFLRLRFRMVHKVLRSLDETSGTGPDLLPSKILKRCAKQLALPVALLSRKCLNEGRWPQCWRKHWVHPLHKRKSRANPNNYRWVHLTPQLAKVVERSVGSVFIDWMGDNLFGERQYAYSKHKSHRDVLAVNVCSWLLLFEQGHSVGLYCSDVSAAFDRVSMHRMHAKLDASGLPPNVIAFLKSWLEDRVSNVIVGGVMSVDSILANSVFQGTVLGPPLWNLYYADAKQAVRNLGFTETVFADDFNSWKGFRSVGMQVEVRSLIEMRGAQRELHRWGRASQVVFDPAKEKFCFAEASQTNRTEFQASRPCFRPKASHERWSPTNCS